MNVSSNLAPDGSPTNAQDLMTVADVAKELKLAKKTVADWIRAGVLPALRIGRERRVLRSTLSDFLAEKAQDAQEEAARKRNEQVRKDGLRRLQSLEPEQRWQEVNCISCLAPTNASRHQRLDGRALCQACVARVRSEGWTKEMWDRRITLEVKERNVMIEELPDTQLERMERQARNLPIEVIRAWIIYRCGFCDKPKAIHRSNVFDQSYEPSCSHEPPFGGDLTSGDRSIVYKIDADRQAMLIALAELEIQEREYDAGLSPIDRRWWVGQCAGCDEELAVVDWNILMSGKGRCRKCHSLELDSRHQMRAIMSAIRRFHPKDTVYPSSCSCEDGQEQCRADGAALYWRDAQGEAYRLSWCSSGDWDELRRLARTYAERVGLSKKATEDLMDDVSRHVFPF